MCSKEIELHFALITGKSNMLLKTNERCFVVSLENVLVYCLATYLIAM